MASVLDVVNATHQALELDVEDFEILAEGEDTSPATSGPTDRWWTSP